ncbi:MAG: AbrB/MazE/SpoVT family DNA-binding domain-containing protein [Actinomycetia bacterium]|nr:AbrB/MazE/SpoVT family DNA-binding domain-containing protein [Actinomycetes bacterium]
MNTVTMSSRGRITIPESYRKRLELEQGDTLIIHYDETKNELRLHRKNSLAEMRERYTSWIKPGTEPLIDIRGVIYGRPQ